MEPDPLLSDPAPPRPAPVVPVDPDALWEEAMRQQAPQPEDEDDPFGVAQSLEQEDRYEKDTPLAKAARAAFDPLDYENMPPQELSLSSEDMHGRDGVEPFDSQQVSQGY